jgi:hypothetical protein
LERKLFASLRICALLVFSLSLSGNRFVDELRLTIDDYRTVNIPIKVSGLQSAI